MSSRSRFSVSEPLVAFGEGRQELLHFFRGESKVPCDGILAAPQGRVQKQFVALHPPLQVGEF